MGRRSPRPHRHRASRRAFRRDCSPPSKRARRRASIARTTPARAGTRVNSDPRVVARPARCARGARPSDQPGHRVRADDRHVEVHRWRQDVHRVSRRAGRRRLPAASGSTRRSRHHARNVRSGRHRHAQWRRSRGAAGTTSRPRRSITSPPTTRFRIASAAASRRAARCASQAAETTGRSRSASGIRSASRNTATSRPIRSIPTSFTAARCRDAIAAPGRCRTSRRSRVRTRRLSRRSHHAGAVLARQSAQALLRLERAVADDERRRDVGSDQPGPHAQDVGRSSERRHLHRAADAAQPTPARRDLHDRAVVSSTRTRSGPAPTTG